MRRKSRLKDAILGRPEMKEVKRTTPVRHSPVGRRVSVSSESVEAAVQAFITERVSKGWIINTSMLLSAVRALAFNSTHYLLYGQPTDDLLNLSPEEFNSLWNKVREMAKIAEEDVKHLK